MGCGGSKDTARPNKKIKKKANKKGRKKGSAPPPDKLNMDKFLNTDLYCPTTELDDQDCVARGTRDDDIAYLVRDVEPGRENVYHFELISSAHLDFAVGVAQINPVSGVIFEGNTEDEVEPVVDEEERRLENSGSDNGAASDAEASGGEEDEDSGGFEKQTEVERSWEYFFRDGCAHFTHHTDDVENL